MRKQILFIVILLIIGCIFLYFNKNNESYIKTFKTLDAANQKKQSSAIFKHQSKLSVDRIITKFLEPKTINLSKEVKAIRKDINQLNPCEFIEKYKNIDDHKLFLALKGKDAYQSPLSLLFLSKIPFENYEMHLNDIDPQTSLFLLTRDFHDSLIYPNDILNTKKEAKYYFDLIETHSPKDNEDIDYLKINEFLTSKNEILVSNTMDKLDSAVTELDANPVISLILSGHAYREYSIVHSVFDDKKIEKYYDYNLIKIKASQMLYSRIQSLYQNSIDRVEDLSDENVFELNSLLPLKMRNYILGKANNATEIALLNHIYENKVNSFLALMLTEIKYLNDFRPKASEWLKKYLVKYIQNIEKTKNLNFINPKLYNLIKVFDSKQDMSFEEFSADKKGLFDPIYGQGCDDRRFKDICTKLCQH